MRALPLAATAAFLLFSVTAAPAAVPANLDPAPLASKQSYELNTVLVVHNWVLCVSQESAEELVRAREAGREAAAKAYAELAAAKSCGQFQKLGVQLRQPLYRSPPGGDFDARAFGALVNIGVGWQEGFVVAGSLPE